MPASRPGSLPGPGDLVLAPGASKVVKLVQTDGNGGASLTAGKYLSDKTYSEVTVDQGGKSSISLNYDVARHITLKVHVDSEGATGAGVYLKRDY